MKKILFVTALLLVVNACNSLKTFTHQLGPEDEYSFIEVMPPDITHREIQEAHIPSTIVEVFAIDDIPVAYKPGESQSFRVIPGKHEIKYKKTSYGYFPLSPTFRYVSMLITFGLYPHYVDESYGHEYHYFSTNLITEAGKHYRLNDLKIEVFEINEMELSQ